MHKLFSASLPSFFSLITLATSACCAVDTPTTYDSSMFMASLKTLWGLLIVLAIIFAIYAFVRKKFSFLPGTNEKSIIKIIEAKHLMPKKSIYLMEVRNKEYLVGVTDHTISLLSTNHSQQSFQEILDQKTEGDEENGG